MAAPSMPGKPKIQYGAHFQKLFSAEKMMSARVTRWGDF
jgi:hypothetical protein